jgi:hypothetical protein
VLHDMFAVPVLRQKCFGRHVVRRQRVHNGDADRRVGRSG